MNQLRTELQNRKDKTETLGAAVDGRIKILRLNDLEPREFERLCLRVIEREHQISDLYGKSGQDQHGIDVFAYDEKRDTHIVYQCKRYQNYTVANLDEAVAALEIANATPTSKAAQWLKQTNEAILCLSVVVSDERNLVDAFVGWQIDLRKVGIDFWYWDTPKLCDKLRYMPDVVEEFYGLDGVKQFCPESIAIPYLSGSKARSILEIPKPTLRPKDIPVPSAMLTARNRIVPFEGRDAEITDLQAWLQGDDFKVRLYTGAGGAGKTRLLLELCLTQTDQYWITGFTKRNDKRITDSQVWQDLLEQPRAVLVVFDYANAQPEAIKAFCAALNNVRGTKQEPVRVVLLARAEGSWYKSLLDDSACDLLPREQSLWKKNIEDLPNLGDTVLAQEAFARACQNYALASGIANPPTQPLNLRQDMNKRVLFAHIAALLTVTGNAPQSNSSPEILLEEVLRLERQHWTRGLGSAAWHDGIERLMTLITLGWHTPNREAAMKALQADAALENKVFALSQLTATEQNAILEMLHTTYPSQQYINPIEPDLLAEHLIYKQLTHLEIGEILRHTAFGSNQAEPDKLKVNPQQALPHLIRVREWRSNTAQDLWKPVLDGRLNNIWHNLTKNEPLLVYTIWAIQEQTKFTTDLDTTLATLVEKNNDQTLVAQAIGKMPFYSVSLLKTDEVLKRLYINNNNDWQRLRNMGNHARSLKNAGKIQEALDTEIEVVTGFRKLHSCKPGIFKSDFATSLNNLSTSYIAVEQYENAYKMAVEAVSVAQEKPPTSKSILASSFNSLGTACTALGQYQNAYNAISKGTDLFYELKQEKSDEFKLENLANSLNNLGRTLTSLKQYERAVKELLEVVRFYRILTDDKPNEFKPYLAFSLTSLGIAYAKWGQLENIPASTLENALTSTLEAVQITRDLYIAASAAFAIRYAERLNSLSDRYRELRQFQPAHQNAQMAIKVLCTPFLKSPQALSGLMHRLVLDYCEICDVLKLEPDLEFLNPILSILKSFLQQNTQSPNL